MATAFAVVWQDEAQGSPETRGALVVWDLATGKECFRKYTAVALHATTFDPQGRVLAAGGSPVGGMVFGWDAESGKEVLSLRGHTRPILSLAIGPDDRLVTGGADRVVKVWDLESKREILTLDGFAREVVHLAYAKDGKSLVAATGLNYLTTMTTAGGLPSEWAPAEVRVYRGRK